MISIYLTSHQLKNMNNRRTVIETLKSVQDDRRCYRLVGGVLCGRTVKDVLPELTANKDQLENMVTMGGDQLTKKGQEINKYIEQNNIRIRGDQETESQHEQIATETLSDAHKQTFATN